MAKQFRRSDRISWHPFQIETQAEQRDQTERSDTGYRAVFQENPSHLLGGNQQHSRQVEHPHAPLSNPYDNP
jgi:hypothetical protein